MMAGFHASSSFRIDRHTVPEGYTLGWNSGGTNLPGQEVRIQSWCKQASTCLGHFQHAHFGGFVGYSAIAKSAVCTAQWT